MSGVGQSEDGVEASTSGMMETTMMEGEEYYNPDDTGTWAQKEMSDQLCRICAKPNQYLIPIFEGEGIEHQLEPKIQKHLPIEVSESDDLPLQVCYQCASTLIAWNDLVIACIEADKKLRQMHEQEEEDEDDKGAEFFDEPILDSDEGEEPVQPSTSIATVASDTQSDTTSHPKRSPGKAKKPKLKMTLVKSPTAGPSGLKSPLKRVASKPKEDAGQEATERLPQPHATFKAFQQAQSSLQVLCQKSSTYVQWIKSEASNMDQSSSDCRLECSQEDSLVCPYGKFKEELNVLEQVVQGGDECDGSDSGSLGSDTFVPVEKCNEKAKLSAKVRVVTRNNSKLSSYQCVLCKKVFTRKFYLDKHVKCHDNFQLVDVQIKSEASDLEVQMPEEHGTENVNKKNKQTFHCDVCSKNFSLKDSYFRHLRIHSGERPFTCHICGKSFRDSGGLARHLKDVHAGIKNFPCDICGRSFASKATREDHRRIHTGERPYVCDSCGKTFKSKASLYLHSKIHTDSFPHPCTHCSKRFRRRQEFLAHVTTHTGEKPYPCDACGKSFRVKGELLRHKLIHSENKPYVCSLCGLSFRQKRYLRNHEKSRHNSRIVDMVTASHRTLMPLH